MGRPVFLAENVFNVSQFPRHIISSPTNNEPFRVGASRRGISGTVPTTEFSTPTVVATLDRVRLMDLIVFDRNLSFTPGDTLEVKIGNDGGLDLQEIIDTEIPSDIVYGSSLEDPAHFIRTEEGALVVKFPEVAGSYVQITLAGSGTFKTFGGIYLGKSYEPIFPRMPWDSEVQWTEQSFTRRGVPDNDARFGRSSQVSLMLADEQEYDGGFRPYVRKMFGRGHPMWFFENDKAERGWLATNAGGQINAPFSERPQGRTVVLELEEYAARLP